MEEVRQLLRKLDRRLAEGEIDEAAYDRQRDRILANLTPAERAVLGLTPTPQPVQPVPAHVGMPAPGGSISGTPFPATPGRVPLGPSGARGKGLGTRVGSLSDLDLRPGAVLLDRWQVEKELGRGGFGVVLLAEDRVLRQRQAVKVLDPVMVGKEQLLERFRREVTSTRSLVHPRIVRVYDYAEDLPQGLALFSMEYIEGTSVAGLLGKARARKDVVPVPLALTILAQVLEALGTAHEQGVIHRDVTPANILLAGGTAEELLADPRGDPKVKLVDFGIAGTLERSELSQKSRVLGTGRYVAPEVLDPNAEVTSAADVYGAGAVFYELLTQKVPVLRFRDPSQLREGLDPGIDRLSLELLDPEAERRPKARAGAEAAIYLQGEEERQQERERQEAEKRQAEEKAKKKRERQEAERRQAEEKAKKERKRQEAEKRQAEEKAKKKRERQEAGRRRAEEEAKQERERQEAEKRRAEESERKAEEKSRTEERVLQEKERQRELERQVEALPVRTVLTARSEFSIVRPGHPWYPKVIDERQEAEAKRLGLPLVIEEAKSGIVLVFVPGGRFWMGANPSDEMASGDEKPRHEVTLRPFYVGVAAVLQEQWQRVMGNSPSQFKGDRHPVERVSWDDAKRFLEILDSRLRLPTEAEWEYAARGGREGDRYPWGNELSASNAKYGGGGTVPVGMFAANGFGLYDMSGNVLEWCGDWFDERYYAKSPSRDPQGPSGGSGRVVRGGSWYYVGGGGLLRVSNRDRNVPTKRNDGLGFRCVRDAGSP